MWDAAHEPAAKGLGIPMGFWIPPPSWLVLGPGVWLSLAMICSLDYFVGLAQGSLCRQETDHEYRLFTGPVGSLDRGLFAPGPAIWGTGLADPIGLKLLVS